MFQTVSKTLVRNLSRLHTVIEYPRLLRTIGSGINRDFAKDFLFIQSKLGITPETVFDIGAAVGEYSQAVRFVFPNAKVYAFEPIPKSYEKLAVVLAGDPHVHLFECALSNENETKEFRLNEFTFSSSLLSMTERHKEVFPQTQKEQSMTVRCRRLDSLELEIERPSLMKIDVQGAELNVLYGAGELLQKFTAVQLEVNFEEFYAGQPNYSQIMSYMFDHGFRRFLQFETVFMAEYGLTHSDLLFF